MLLSPVRFDLSPSLAYQCSDHKSAAVCETRCQRANTAFVDGPSICIDGDEFDVKKDNRMLKVDKVRFHFEDEIAASTPPPTPPPALTSAQSDGTSPL